MWCNTAISTERLVPAGKTLFSQALLDGTMQGFFKLIEQFRYADNTFTNVGVVLAPYWLTALQNYAYAMLYRTQDEPAFCGLASLAMVLNALAIDPRRAWKGPWRWFHEQMLDCCQPLSQVIETGVILDQV